MLPKSEIILRANLYREPSINTEVDHLLYASSTITACPLPNNCHLLVILIIFTALSKNEKND